MTSLLLSLVMLCQTDHGFVRAQEEWIIGTIPVPVIASEHAPREIGRWIDQLGSECWACWEIAGRKLRSIGEPAIPWMFWGLRSHDAQIRLSCWLVLRDLAGCRFCRGTGQCYLYEPESGSYSCMGCGCGEYLHTQPDATRPCNRCGGRAGALDIRALKF